MRGKTQNEIIHILTISFCRVVSICIGYAPIQSTRQNRKVDNSLVVTKAMSSLLREPISGQNIKRQSKRILQINLAQPVHATWNTQIATSSDLATPNYHANRTLPTRSPTKTHPTKEVYPPTCKAIQKYVPSTEHPSVHSSHFAIDGTPCAKEKRLRFRSRADYVVALG